MAQQSTTDTETIREAGLYTLTVGSHVVPEYLVYITNTVTDDDTAGFLYNLADFIGAGEVSYYVMDDGRIVPPTSGLPEPARATLADLVDTGRTMDGQQDLSTQAGRVMAALDINADQLNSMYVACPVGGFVGTVEAEQIRQQFGLRDDEPFGEQLAERGVLSWEDAEWFDDQD